MKLSEYNLNNKHEWEKINFNLPQYNIEDVKNNTKKSPKWIHFGAGNIFRAFLANAQQNLLNKKIEDTGIIVAEGFDYEIIDKAWRNKNNLGILVTLHGDSSVENTLLASVVESLKLDSENEEEFSRLKEIFRNPSLQMASFTITEKGYSLVNSKNETLPDILDDFKIGPAKPKSYIGKIASLCYERFKSGKLKISMVSMDNCSENGTKLFNAINSFAKSWVENNLVEEEFLNYINDENYVGFPWSMIDKITPRPDDSIKKQLEDLGIEDIDVSITNKNSYTAPFVNAEVSEYLVIEDKFPNGKPNLDKVGIIFTNKETVSKVEKMKVCTCLNPLHTALAIFGCLLSFETINSEMKDEDLVKLINIVGYKEGLPVVVDPKIINPKEFIDEVINVRFPNPFIPDTPQRIATDTSQKLSIRFGETIKAYNESSFLKTEDLKLIPLVLAGWCRYLTGINDNGEKFEISPDPLLSSLKKYFEDFKLGENFDIKKLQPLLSDENIFGVNLYSVGLGELVENYFLEMIKEKGSVRNTLNRAVNL